MAKTTVQVVLRDDVENLGRSGELVRVKPGFARNYLMPRGLAAIATHGNVAQIEHEKRSAVIRAAKARSEAEETAGKLNNVRVTIEAKAGEGGKLFGSVGSKDIAEALAAKGHDVDRRKILLDDPIKEVGDHDVNIKIGYEVTASIKVTVNATE